MHGSRPLHAAAPGAGARGVKRTAAPGAAAAAYATADVRETAGRPRACPRVEGVYELVLLFSRWCTARPLQPCSTKATLAPHAGFASRGFSTGTAKFGKNGVCTRRVWSTSMGACLPPLTAARVHSATPRARPLAEGRRQWPWIQYYYVEKREGRGVSCCVMVGGCYENRFRHVFYDIRRLGL